MALIISRPSGDTDRDRYWWVAAAVALPMLVVAAVVDAITMFLLLSAVSDGCDPNVPVDDQAWRGEDVAVGIALALACTGVVATLLLPHKRQWRAARYLTAVLTVLAGLVPAFWDMLAYSGAVTFKGCH